MGFLSYSLRYYREKIEQYETEPLTPAAVYEAKQLLKMLDDLLDEGYTALNQQMEETFSGVTRLKRLLTAWGQAPFPLPAVRRPEGEYGAPQELTAYLKGLRKSPGQCGQPSRSPFLGELERFCAWIGYRDDTAYVFLLRDTLLPFLYYQAAGRENLYPWLIGRKFVDSLSSAPHLDDHIRAVFFEALESGMEQEQEFLDYSRREIKKRIRQFPAVEKALRQLLEPVAAPKILVIESGCYGTFPMLLCSLDERADFRMFTTVPFLLPVYGARIYSGAYEKNRLFETFCCHDQLFRFHSFTGSRFYVEEHLNPEILTKSRQEICGMLAPNHPKPQGLCWGTKEQSRPPKRRLLWLF